jgi:REP element-mobilizing transposase RayT
MSTYTQILYQIVFTTKDRKDVLLENNREKLFRFIWGILKNKNCVLYQINGVEDHLHIATHLHPTIALSSLVKDIKVASSLWIKENQLFPGFNSWQEGYGGFTYSIKEKGELVNYIKAQKEHHRVITFRDEYIELLKEHGIEFDERFLL